MEVVVEVVVVVVVVAVVVCGGTAGGPLQRHQPCPHRLPHEARAEEEGGAVSVERWW